MTDSALTLERAIALATMSASFHGQLGLLAPAASASAAVAGAGGGAGAGSGAADAAVVRKRYLLLARLLHPDKVRAERAGALAAQAEEAFKRVQTAYRSLTGDG